MSETSQQTPATETATDEAVRPPAANDAEQPPATGDAECLPPADGAGRQTATDEAARFESSPFYVALVGALRRRGLRPADVCDPCDPCTRRLLAEYGAMFVAADTVVVPSACVFRDEEEVARFQELVRPRAADFDGVVIELQPAALDALLGAREEARRAGLDIRPRGGAEAARRSFADTVRLWESRLRPALEHWTRAGQFDEAEAERLCGLELAEQLGRVLDLEARGVFFSKCFSKSILQSVAAPGASQHLALLAFDAVEFTNTRVREILARHGWFQTVRSDLPHFTFLGVSETDLPRLGLKRVEDRGQAFWIPDVNGENL